jgi:hypothetical protein
MYSKTFIERCLNGEADLSDIDKYIENWHRTPDSISLHEYLGMSFEEYSIWVEKPSSLPYILSAKKFHTDLHSVLVREEEPFSLAARASDQTEPKKIFEWLKKTKRI